jgi:hypothetical protein
MFALRFDLPQCRKLAPNESMASMQDNDIHGVAETMIWRYGEHAAELIGQEVTELPPTRRDRQFRLLPPRCTRGASDLVGYSARLSLSARPVSWGDLR